MIQIEIDEIRGDQMITFSNRRIKNFSIFLYRPISLIQNVPLHPSSLDGRRKKEEEEVEEKCRKEKGPRRGWKERFESGLLSGSTWRGGGVFHYTLRKFICVNGAHFSTGPGRTWARFSPLYSPDNGVTLHSFVLVDLVYFSSVAFDRAARVPQPPFPKPLLCRGKSTGQKWSATKQTTPFLLLWTSRAFYLPSNRYASDAHFW